MSGRTTILLAALAAAPLALAQPAPPALQDALPAPPAAQAPAGAPAPVQAAARPPQPTLADLLQTRIEQVTRGNRVSEVRVTGSSGELRYTMDVGDSRPPEARQAPGTGLSTPNFLTIDF